MALPQKSPARKARPTLLPLQILTPSETPVVEDRRPAILGGEAAFDEALHVGRPNVGDRGRLQERFDAMLDARWFSNGGPLVQEFEGRIAKHLGVKHCLATCNGTTALMLAVRGLDMKGEVIVPSFTFVATAHALQWQQTKPVFCDIDPVTHNLDPLDVERRITPETTGIIGVHLWGRPCDTTALEDIAQRHGLKLLFDASHAFDCTSGGRMIGSFGDAEVFSFHATKFLNAFEGGAVVTNNDEVARKLRLMRNFGFTGYDTVEYLGMNAKMTEVCAAMGLTGLESIDQFIAVNRRNHAGYQTQLTGLPGLRVLPFPEGERSNFQYVILEIDPAECPLTRDELLRVLHADNILARRYFFPGCHRMEPYRNLSPDCVLPVTESISDRVLALPTGTAVGHREVEMVASVIRGALRDAVAIKAALAV
ncbi:MAG: DegT/DnrJ/EryC1/StrS family aminotransferase [Chthoniobacteraceae bacterium]